MSVPEEGRIYKDKEKIIPIHTDDIALFNETPTNIAVDRISWVKQGPAYRNEEGNNFIHFHLTGEGNQYTNLSKTTLNVKIQIVNEDGSFFVQETGKRTAVPVDNILHSLWDHVDVKLNNKVVSFSTNNYMYKSLFENLLFFNKNARDFQTHSFGFFGESGNFAQTNPTASPFNSGMFARYQLFKGQQFIHEEIDPQTNQFLLDEDTRQPILHDPTVVEFEGPLLADILGVNKVILNAVDIDIFLQPSSDAFRLVTFPQGTKAKIKIVDIYLNVCKIDVDPAARLGINKGLEMGKDALYPFRQGDVIIKRVTAGSYGATLDNLFQGYVPSKVLVGFVDSSAYSGNFNMNPFHFQHFNVSKIGFFVDNIPTPTQPLEVNIKNGAYLEGYLSLFRVSGKLNDDIDFGIDRTAYRQGYNLFGFNVDPTTCEDMSYKEK